MSGRSPMLYCTRVIAGKRRATIRMRRNGDAATEYPLPPLARHRAVPPAVWLRGADAESAPARNRRRPLPAGILRRPDVLAEPGGLAHRAVPAHEWDDGPRAPRLRPA